MFLFLLPSRLPLLLLLLLNCGICKKMKFLPATACWLLLSLSVLCIYAHFQQHNCGANVLTHTNGICVRVHCYCFSTVSHSFRGIRCVRPALNSNNNNTLKHQFQYVDFERLSKVLPRNPYLIFVCKYARPSALISRKLLPTTTECWGKARNAQPLNSYWWWRWERMRHGMRQQ